MPDLCFVFSSDKGLTSRHHSGGGALAIAATVDRARDLIHAAIVGDCLLSAWDPEPGDSFDSLPDAAGYLAEAKVDVIGLRVDQPERVWIFPNAGCC